MNNMPQFYLKGGKNLDTKQGKTVKYKQKHKHNLAGWCFILPTFIGFLTFMIYPLFYSLFLSFMDWDMFRPENSVFVGLDNYIAAFKNDYFQAGITNNLFFAIIAVPVLIFIALILAALLNQKIFGRGMLRMMYFVPYITTVTAVAVVFSALFHPVRGPVNALLSSLGVADPPGWAVSSDWSLITVAIFWVWKNIGYCTVIFLAGLQGISRSLYEAADIDGATPLQKFFRITVPMVSPTTFFLSVTCVIQSLQIFAEINVITDGGPGTSSYTTIMHIYEEAFVKFNMGYASAVTWIFFVMILGITFIQWIAQKKWVKYV